MAKPQSTCPNYLYGKVYICDGFSHEKSQLRPREESRCVLSAWRGTYSQSHSLKTLFFFFWNILGSDSGLDQARKVFLIGPVFIGRQGQTSSSCCAGLIWRWHGFWAGWSVYKAGVTALLLNIPFGGTHCTVTISKASWSFLTFLKQNKKRVGSTFAWKPLCLVVKSRYVLLLLALEWLRGSPGDTKLHWGCSNPLC